MVQYGRRERVYAGAIPSEAKGGARVGIRETGALALGVPAARPRYSLPPPGNVPRLVTGGRCNDVRVPVFLRRCDKLGHTVSRRAQSHNGSSLRRGARSGASLLPCCGRSWSPVPCLAIPPAHARAATKAVHALSVSPGHPSLIIPRGATSLNFSSGHENGKPFFSHPAFPGSIAPAGSQPDPASQPARQPSHHPLASW